jgi:hypothetical protein
MPAMTKASASCFLENLTVFEDGVSALVGFLLGSVGFHNSAAADRVGSRSWTALLLFMVLGRQWLLLPGLALEAIPALGVLPFWLLVVGAIAVLGTPRPRFEGH